VSAALIRELVEYFLGLLVTAGDYALAIQPKVGAPAQKNGHNAWVSALTDADLSVQNFIEVATLARYPAVGFYGEEHAQSLNQKYFPRDAEISVHVDPINGTFLYKNQRARWDIIISIAQRRRLMAAVSYVPSSGRFYLGLRDAGAFTGERRHARLAELVPLHTRPGSRQCLTYQAPELRERLRGEFDCHDIVADDDPVRTLDNLNGLDNLNEFYSGRLAAFACRAGECLDWGAAAFIATHAGGKASHLDGSPLGIFEDFDPQEAVDMIVAADAATHAAIMSRLA
jgi:fructose-1,6-bisphosphatase/inositol monophosphatase family enzyme